MRAWLRQQHQMVDARLLAFFRIVFGAAMFYEMNDWRHVGVLPMGILGPKLLFKYEGFGWITPLSPELMDLVLAGACIAALCVCIGLLYRAAIVYFFFAFGFLFMQDKAMFNNHLYLFGLVALLLSFMPAQRVWSLDSVFFGKKNATALVPRWTTTLLRMQFFIVYLYGGFAKLNPDWLLRQEPMRALLQPPGAAAPGLAHSDLAVYFFTYGGVLFDLCIGFLLWWKRTRWYTVPLVLLFNITNHFLFDDIGVFPFVMLPATFLFFDPAEVGVWLDQRHGAAGRRHKRKTEDAPSMEGPARQRLVRALAGAYLAFQLLFPFRWWLLPGKVDWTTIGQRFSWRMKVDSRGEKGSSYFYVAPNGQRREIQVNRIINTMQQQYSAHDPRMAITFAHYLKEQAAAHGMPDARITSEIIIQYNGRPARYLFPPEEDLSALAIDNTHPEKWVPPFEPTGPEYFLKR